MAQIGDFHYIPDFLDEQEESYLLEKIYTAPKPKWRQLSNRKLQNWGGTVCANRCLIQDAPLPRWLENCIDKIMALRHGTFPSSNRPNHVLINEYLPGQGIMPHTDGPAFFPLICTISLGSHILLDFYEQEEKEENEKNEDKQENNIKKAKLMRKYAGSLLLEPRSLILIQNEAYHKLLHSIEERTIDKIDDISTILNRDQLGKPILTGEELKRRMRVSLTIRNVPNVKRILRCFPGTIVNSK